MNLHFISDAFNIPGNFGYIFFFFLFKRIDNTFFLLPLKGLLNNQLNLLLLNLQVLSCLSLNHSVCYDQ